MNNLLQRRWEDICLCYENVLRQKYGSRHHLFFASLDIPLDRVTIHIPFLCLSIMYQSINQSSQKNLSLPLPLRKYKKGKW